MFFHLNLASIVWVLLWVPTWANNYKDLDSSCSLSASIDRLTDALTRNGPNRVQENLVEHFRRSIHLEDKVKALQIQLNELKEESERQRKELLRPRKNTGIFFNAVRWRKLPVVSGDCYRCPVTYDTTVSGVSQDDEETEMFDADTGTFLAPKAGFYFFQFHALADHGHQAQAS